MAPSIQQLAEDISQVTVDPVKLAEARKDTPKEETKEETKEDPKESLEEKPYVKRQIDVEGGTTTASVHHPLPPNPPMNSSLTKSPSTHNTSQPGTTGRNTHL